MVDENLLVATTGLVEWLKNRYSTWEGVAQFGDTPARTERMYREFCWTPEKIETELDRHFRSFEHKYDQMLVKKEIEVWTLCPHHLLPCLFKVSIGYVPNGKVLGLSKLTRIADTMARRPIMQEAYSDELVNTLMDRLEPKGVAVYILGTHGCMTSRGVRQHADVITSSIRGCFETEPETRAEFMAICRS